MAKFNSGQKCRVINNFLSSEHIGQEVTVIRVANVNKGKVLYEVDVDGLHGYESETCLEIIHKKIRKMPMITNEQKLEVIKDFLRENNIPFEENHVSKRCGVTIPLEVKKHRVAIRIGDNQDFYLVTMGKYYPIFVRDEDTKAKSAGENTEHHIKVNVD